MIIKKQNLKNEQEQNEGWTIGLCKQDPEKKFHSVDWSLVNSGTNLSIGHHLLVRKMTKHKRVSYYFDGKITLYHCCVQKRACSRVPNCASLTYHRASYDFAAYLSLQPWSAISFRHLSGLYIHLIHIPPILVSKYDMGFYKQATSERFHTAWATL
jgi:hypothetical protein